MSGGNRHGFALVLVVLMAAIGTLIVTVMLTRMSAERRAMRRLVESYHLRHDTLGLQEVVHNWMRSLQVERVADLLAPDGHMLTVSTGDGQSVALYAADGQGTLLSDFSSLEGQLREDAARALDALRVLVGQERAAELTRLVGPAAVSLASAEIDVLRAVAMAVTTPAKAEIFVKQVSAARAGREGITQVTLNEAATRADILGEERTRLFALVTTEPELLAYVAEISEAGGRRGPVRGFAGLMRPDRRSVGRTMGAEAFLPHHLFLTAEPIRYEDGVPVSGPGMVIVRRIRP